MAYKKTLEAEQVITTEQAFDDLEGFLMNGTAPSTKAIILAMQALTYRNKMKATRSDSGMFYICPNCNKFIDKYEHSYGKIPIPHCKWCGQAFDWEVKT